MAVIVGFIGIQGTKRIRLVLTGVLCGSGAGLGAGKAGLWGQGMASPPGMKPPKKTHDATRSEFLIFR
jgi:hypothetical protein